jgi:hypothetical protein
LSGDDKPLDEQGETQPSQLIAELFRAVNERIKELGTGYSLAELNLVCECGDERCTRHLAMTPQEYEQLRQHPGRFAVLAGHQQPDDELIACQDGFLIVARRSDAPEGLADPQNAEGPG